MNKKCDNGFDNHSEAKRTLEAKAPKKGIRLSWTPILEHYRETGEMPEDPLLRKTFQSLLDKGVF